MDPKTLSHLDPKMKETYERVMGTAATASTDSTSSPSPSNLSDNLPADTAGGQPLSTTPSTDTQEQSAEQYNAASSATPDSNNNPVMSQESPFFSNDNPASSSDTSQDLANNLGTPVEPPSDTASSDNNFTPGAPVTPYSEATQTPGVAEAPSPQPLQSPAASNDTGPHETSALLKVLYIVGAVVFFMIYTIFWIKVFNLPFLF